MTAIPSAKSIRPAVAGHADFFSWQLYRWVRKHPEASQVWRGTWAGVGPCLFIGEMGENGWFLGNRMRRICGHGQRIERYAYPPGGWPETPEEVTESWWPEYMRIGVCAIHDWSHDWREADEHRTCARCGKRQVKRVKTIKREYWEAAA